MIKKIEPKNNRLIKPGFVEDCRKNILFLLEAQKYIFTSDLRLVFALLK